MSDRKIKKFQVSTRYSGRLRTVKVCVYDDLEKMRHDATKFSRGWGDIKDGYFNDALGICQSFHKGRVGNNGRMYEDPDSGFIRLHKDNLSAGIVAHEVTHMAAAIFEQDCLRNGDPFDNMKQQEILCNLIGHLLSRINDKLWDLGCHGERPVKK